MTEAELTKEINDEVLPFKPEEGMPQWHDHWTASREAVTTARALLTSAVAMLADPNPINLRSEIMARLSAVTALVGSL